MIRHSARALVALSLALSLGACAGTDGPATEPASDPATAVPMPEPAPLHPFLARMVGDWEITNRVDAPDGSTMKMEATESIEAIGPWIVSSMRASAGGTEFDARLQVAFDADANAFVGTWADSSSTYLWEYEGELDGDTLTLEAEGPSYEDPSFTTRFRDIVTIVAEDRREHRSEMRLKDGTWVQMVSGTSTRVD